MSPHVLVPLLISLSVGKSLDHFGDTSSILIYFDHLPVTGFPFVDSPFGRFCVR